MSITSRKANNNKKNTDVEAYNSINIINNKNADNENI